MGRVIQISRGEATNPYATMPDYAATKAALVNGVESFFRSVAADRGWGDDWAEIEAHILREILDNPTGRLGRAEDVALVAALLSSPLAGYVNGASYRVDGGSTAVIN
jgi:NAD(P)-dependent dehydrogenase (short-subunit alcohol dehydrogenase family)